MLRKVMSLIVLGLFCSAVPALAETILPPQLTVTGEAVLQVPADQATLRVGVETDAETAEAALSANSKTLQKVEQALHKSGLGKGEYSTGNFQVRPRWSQRPRNADTNWRPQIVGYTVSNSFDVKTRKLEKLGALIEATTKAGANALGQIAFGLADPRTYRAAAIEAATANALADAAALAKAAGVALDGILSLNLDHASVPTPRPMVATMAMRSMDAEVAPSIVAPEDIEVRASVSVVYRIKGVVGQN